MKININDVCNEKFCPNAGLKKKNCGVCKTPKPDPKPDPKPGQGWLSTKTGLKNRPLNSHGKK